MLGRTLVAWLPVLLAPVAGLAANAVGVGVSELQALTVSMGLGLAVLLAGAAFAIARPERGIQDRVANTGVVPR